MADEFDLDIVKDLNKSIDKFLSCMEQENESIYETMPLNLGDMFAKKGPLLGGKESAGGERQMFFDFDIFDRFDKKGNDKFDSEKIEKLKTFQKVKYCSRISGMDKI